MAGAMNRSAANKPFHVFVRVIMTRIRIPHSSQLIAPARLARAPNCTYTFARNMFLQEHCGKLLCLPTNALIFKDFPDPTLLYEHNHLDSSSLHRICMMDGPWPARPPVPTSRSETSLLASAWPIVWAIALAFTFFHISQQSLRLLPRRVRLHVVWRSPAMGRCRPAR